MKLAEKVLNKLNEEKDGPYEYELVDTKKGQAYKLTFNGYPMGIIFPQHFDKYLKELKKAQGSLKKDSSKDGFDSYRVTVLGSKYPLHGTLVHSPKGKEYGTDGTGKPRHYGSHTDSSVLTNRQDPPKKAAKILSSGEIVKLGKDKFRITHNRTAGIGMEKI